MENSMYLLECINRMSKKIESLEKKIKELEAETNKYETTADNMARRGAEYRLYPKWLRRQING